MEQKIRMEKEMQDVINRYKTAIKDDKDKKYFERNVADVFINDYTDEQRAEMEADKSLNSNLTHVGKGKAYYFPASHETRTQIAISNTGALTVGTFTQNMLSAVRAHTVLGGLATFIDGQKSTLKLIDYSGTTANWKAENGTALDGGGSFKEVSYTPSRLTAFIDVSELAFTQSPVLENILLNDLAKEIATKLELAIFASSSIASAPQRSIFKLYNTGSALVAGSVTKAKFNLAEKTVGNNGYNANAILTNWNGLEKIRNAYVSQSIISDEGKINNLPIYATANIPTSAVSVEDCIVVGDFTQLYVGTFGGLQIVIDPFTQALNGNVRITANLFADFAMRNDGAIVTGSLK